jgi:antitoxin component HigA of HigAB toxin-antitoxin module
MKTKRSKVGDSYLALIHEFPLRPIRNDSEFESASKIMERLAVRDEGSLDVGEQDYLDAITEFVSIYDERHDPFGDDKLTGLDMLKFLMEQTSMKQTEIAKLLGVGTSAVSMILSGDRPITADHARTLGQRFHVEPGIFI